MNDIVQGLTKVRNAMLFGLALSLTFLGIQALGNLFTGLLIKIIVLMMALILFICSIILLYNYFSGFGIIRRANLVNKLNQRIDELKIYMIGSFLLCFLFIVFIVLGSVFLLLPLLYIAFAIIFIAGILSMVAGYRTIQIQGILGVYANSEELKNRAISILFLFKVQIVNAIILNLASLFKSYLDIGYYFILIPSILYSLYFLVVYIGMYNLSIDIYREIE